MSGRHGLFRGARIMSDPNQQLTQQTTGLQHVVCTTMIMLLTAGTLKLMGQVSWCRCGSWSPWSWDIWSSHNSQHLIDPYFFSHVLHGLLFYGALHLCCQAWSLRWRFQAAIVMEAGWELLENSPVIINRYREATIAQDYFGDSIANSMFDILACALGFVLAAKLTVRQSIALFVLTEVAMTLTIRDSLLLNILMLLWPLDAVKEWQMGQ